MLRSMKELEHYTILATDGKVGHVEDFYFDAEKWVVRYVIVDTGTWLSSRKVLISPLAIGHPDWQEKTLPVRLTRAQVEASPSIDTDKPVSRQYEVEYLGYYGYPLYWGSAELWGGGAFPNMMLPGYEGFAPMSDNMLTAEERDFAREALARHQNDDPNLRSCNAVTAYDVHATDGDVGQVQGFLVDENTWAIRYLIVDTSNWWLGHQVLIAPRWVRDISRPDARFSLDLTREQVKKSPAYNPAIPVDREHENVIHQHYGRAGYWVDEQQPAGAIAGGWGQRQM